MEIVGAIIGILLALLNPEEAFGNNQPYELIQEFGTVQECQIAKNNPDQICTTEPDLYSGTRLYARISGMREVSMAVTPEANAISGSENVCKSISGCPEKRGVCPTCSIDKWYIMND
jgi:hypothetical protein